jgi:hypothetical protein
MKFPKPNKKSQPKRVVATLSPLLERLFTHGLNHPNDKCAWNIIKFHEDLYNAWVSRMPKRKPLDN